MTNKDFVTLALTLFGEFRGETKQAIEAGIHVIVNRSKKRKLSIANVCTQKWQFSCWNMDDPNYRIIANPDFDVNQPGYTKVLEVLVDYVKNDPVDFTNGATHYHTTGVAPYWSKNKEPCLKVGKTLFFNNID